MSSQSKRLGLFVHWDPEDTVDDYVVEYTQGLLTVCDEIVFISNSNLSSSEQSKLQSSCHKIILRDNKGLDFGAWQDAIHYLGIDYINQFQELVLANDSCFAPLFPLSEMFEEMTGRDCQFWGITQNNTSYAFGQKVEPHLQSYFLVFHQEILRHPGFLKFYTTGDGSNLNFANTVLEKEIKLTSYFNNLGFQHSAYIQDQSLEDIFTGDTQFFHTTMHNRPNYYWDLLLRRRCPVLKRKVFTDVLQMMFVNHYYIQDHGQRFDAIRDFKSLLTKFKSISDGASIIKHLKRTSTPLQQQLLFDQNLQANCNYLKKLLNQYGHDSLFSFYDGTNLEYDSINKHYTLGRYFFDHQEYQDALVEFNHATQYNAPSIIWYQKGSTELKLEQYQQSLESLEKAQQLEPSNNEIKNIVMKLRSMKQQHPHLFQSKQVISDQPFFDSKWYAKNYLEGKNIEDPWTYFKTQGHKEGHQPNPNFHTMFYRKHYLNNNTSINPVEHYLNTGRSQGLYTKPPMPNPAYIQSLMLNSSKIKSQVTLLLTISDKHDVDLMLSILCNLSSTVKLICFSTDQNILSYLKSVLPNNQQSDFYTLESLDRQRILYSQIKVFLEISKSNENICWLDLTNIHDLNHKKFQLYNTIWNDNVIHTNVSHLSKDKPLIYPQIQPERYTNILKNGSSWLGSNFELSESSRAFLNLDSTEYQLFEFPEYSCFWVKSSELTSLFTSILNILDSSPHPNFHLFFNELLGLKFNLKMSDINITQALLIDQSLQKPISPGIINDQCQQILSSKLFDVKWYLRNYPTALNSNKHPVQYYLDEGWKLNQQPAPWFHFNRDNNESSTINPLLSHISKNKKDIYPSIKPKTRIILFAGFDTQGVIDEYVVDYLKELSKFGDIHYLADCEMDPNEFEKIKSLVVSANAHRHGAYDFGSYSLLATQFVGWDEIEKYDELIFANDSCYLLNSFENVFNKMNESTCDFWGLQLTHGMGATKKPVPYQKNLINHLENVIDINSNLASYENQPFWDLHVGSYFIGFRKNIIMDPDFRLAVESVKQEQNKADIVIKYEMGWTHLLLKKGYQVDSFISKLYPFHPMFTEWYFELLKLGFPLLKRFLLTQNHYYRPNLYQWEKWIEPYCSPNVIGTINKNLNRTHHADLKYLHHIKE